MSQAMLCPEGFGSCFSIGSLSKTSGMLGPEIATRTCLTHKCWGVGDKARKVFIQKRIRTLVKKRKMPKHVHPLLYERKMEFFFFPTGKPSHLYPNRRQEQQRRWTSSRSKWAMANCTKRKRRLQKRTCIKDASRAPKNWQT